MEVRLLGPMEVAGDGGEALLVPGATLRALLAMLALQGGRVVSTDHLIDGLWEGTPPTGVANALQRLVSKLRKVLGSADLVATRPPGYALSIDADSVDVYRFEQLVAQARAALAEDELQAAVQLYSSAEALWRGPPLTDFAFKEFAQPHITRLNELRLELIEERVQAELALGGHTRLIGTLESLVAEHPVRERLRCHLMLALYRSGRQAEALRVFQEGRTMLADELGLEPGPELRRMEAAILSHDPSLIAPAVIRTQRATGERPAQSRTTRPTTVAPALTPLIGRHEELEELTKLVEERRLVTIVGMGGAGKTRVAVELARQAIDRDATDAVLVELAAAHDADGVVGAVAAALEVPDVGSDPLADIQRHCENRSLLLILDNCEHVIDASARVAEGLLSSCDGVHIVATSREPLKVDGEAVWILPALDPADAVELFVQRAASTDTSFQPDDADRAVITEICTRLDGLPLAVELAAARIRAFSVSQIADRLDDRFRLLTGGRRTAAARQQTLRAVVDWSYDLLFDDERRVFECVAIFPGGCTIAAAETMCAGDVAASDVLDIIVGLVDKSLLLGDHSGVEPRYHMLQTLSQYGRERLVERGELESVCSRMAAWAVELCGRCRGAVFGIDQRQWIASVDAERDNLRAAFDWAVRTGDKEIASSIAADLTFWRWLAGGVAEGARWLDSALALRGEVTPFTEGRALVWHAFLGFISGRQRDVDGEFDQGFALLREHADPAFVGYALSFYAQVVGATGRLAKSIELNREALRALGTSSEPWAHASEPWFQAALAVQERGDFDAFESLLHEAAAAFRAIGDQFMTAICLDLIAERAESRGDLAAASAALDEALDIVEGWRMAAFETSLMARRATIAVHMLDPIAEALVERAMARGDEISYGSAHAQALNAFASLRRREGRLDEAQAAASQALDFYRGAAARRFSSSFSRAPQPFDRPVGAATSWSLLGFVAEARGDAPGAIECHRAAYDSVAATAHPRAEPLALEGLAAGVLLDGDAAWAAELLGCAARIRAERRATPTPIEADDIRRVQAAAVDRLAGDGFHTAFELGERAGPAALVTAPTPR